MKSQRRKDLMRILQEGRAASQQDIAAALRDAGHPVTQATVSRDLQELGAVKVRGEGGFVYRLPDELPRPRGGDLLTRNLNRTLAEFAVGVHAAGSLVVVTTPPGHASAVARAIDLAALDECLGTIAGDDTIFVATDSAETAKRVAAVWSGSEGSPAASAGPTAVPEVRT